MRATQPWSNRWSQPSSLVITSNADLRLIAANSDRSELPDVLIVVVESFRRELLEPAVMPNLWEYATKGIHCRTHFSGGNATNHGMFSLLNGLEAIWYERGVRYTPLLNRLFREAGYELGFFAGHDDWRKFYMDGYISEEQFDVFEIAKPEGLKSDRRATELASMFLDRKDPATEDPATEDRRPRLALLYLYATHATYNSYVEDQHFQPAADDRFLYPFSEAVRPAVWNRYKNSARTVDRFLGAVMRDDRVRNRNRRSRRVVPGRRHDRAWDPDFRIPEHDTGDCLCPGRHATINRRRDFTRRFASHVDLGGRTATDQSNHSGWQRLDLCTRRPRFPIGFS